jgi:hypothetical protein
LQGIFLLIFQKFISAASILLNFCISTAKTLNIYLYHQWLFWLDPESRAQDFPNLNFVSIWIIQWEPWFQLQLLYWVSVTNINVYDLIYTHSKENPYLFLNYDAKSTLMNWNLPNCLNPFIFSWTYNELPNAILPCRNDGYQISNWAPF